MQCKLRQAAEAEADRLSGLLADTDLGADSPPASSNSLAQLQDQASMLQVWRHRITHCKLSRLWQRAVSAR